MCAKIIFADSDRQLATVGDLAEFVGMSLAELRDADVIWPNADAGECLCSTDTAGAMALRGFQLADNGYGDLLASPT